MATAFQRRNIQIKAVLRRMPFDCFLSAQKFRQDWPNSRAIRLEVATVFQRRNIQIKAVLRRMVSDCFLSAQNSTRTGQILGDIYIYVLEQLDLKWLRCFSVETYRLKLCCVECSLTAFGPTRILPGLAKFWDKYSNVLEQIDLKWLRCVSVETYQNCAAGNAP